MSLRISRRCPIALMSILVLSSAAMSHVTVSPREAAAGESTVYIVRVPTETSSPTVRIEIQFPDALDVLAQEPKSGWTMSTERYDDGTIRSVEIEGGAIPPRESDEFSFRTMNPDQPAELVWAIRQVYADGNSSEWTPAIVIVPGD